MSGDNQKTKHSPAKYTSNARTEQRAVDFLRFCLDTNKVMHFLSSQDKVPNFDGYLDLLDEDGTSLGMPILVQIKSRKQKGMTLRGLKKNFLSAAKNSWNPVFLFLVITSDEAVIYWKEITPEYAQNQIDQEDEKETVTIKFDKTDIFDGRSLEIYNNWQAIIEKYKNKSVFYDYIFNQISQPISDQYGLDYTNIQIFLDELNHLINRKFPIIKQQLLPNTWELGFAFAEYSSKKLLGTLFPIQAGKVDLKIKRIEESHFYKVTEQVGWFNHLTENPIEIDASKCARQKTAEFLDVVFERDDFKFTDRSLAEEYISSVVKDCREALGLYGRESYTLNELRYAIDTYLPIWIDFALEEVKNSPEILKVFEKSSDPILSNFRFLKSGTFSWDQIREIQYRVIQFKIFKNIRKEIIYTRGDSYSSPQTVIADEFQRCLNLLDSFYVEQSIDLETSELKYKNSFTVENLAALYEAFPDAYQNVVQKNFPQIAHEIDLFKDESWFVYIEEHDRYFSVLSYKNPSSDTSEKVVSSIEKSCINPSSHSCTVNGVFVKSLCQQKIAKVWFEKNNRPLYMLVREYLHKQLSIVFELQLKSIATFGVSSN